MSVRERERERDYMHMFVCVCVCVYVCERDIETSRYDGFECILLNRLVSFDLQESWV